MDVTLQKHCAKFIYAVPDGLHELMSDISREVLRFQPEDIYTFIADYLDALLITRENARVASRLVTTITRIAITTVDLLEQTGMRYEEADRVVSVIQEVFRRHMDIKPSDNLSSNDDLDEENVVTEIICLSSVPSYIADEAGLIIQKAYQMFKERKQFERNLLENMLDWRVAARSAIHLYRKTGVSKEEADRAATLIKAAYKGYYTRRQISKWCEMEKAHPQKDITNVEFLNQSDENEELREDSIGNYRKIAKYSVCDEEVTEYEIPTLAFSLDEDTSADQNEITKSLTTSEVETEEVPVTSITAPEGTAQVETDEDISGAPLSNISSLEEEN
ncbi:uncharacterized protein LOC109609188 [Aethina tumida]|uniref:uncharacterized protein LOC109609188 n=1 Tax=Aethina tumida TaxID=116153 RepID=UPI00096B3D9B|nr:uncharacterized protein LOC109609188 [Aethina tumida]